MEAETCPPPHPEVGQCQEENKNPGLLTLPGEGRWEKKRCQHRCHRIYSNDLGDDPAQRATFQIRKLSACPASEKMGSEVYK